jgi:hypothetical protein
MTDVRNKSRQDRLRAALRENLKRRKQQAKGRAGSAARTVGDDPQPGEDGDDRGGAEKDAAEKSR